MEIVAERGVYDAGELEVHTVDFGDEEWTYHASPGLLADAHDAVKAFIREYGPQIKACHANAAELCRFDDRFDLVEGVTANDHTVDVTRPSDERYGVRVPNATVHA